MTDFGEPAELVVGTDRYIAFIDMNDKGDVETATEHAVYKAVPVVADIVDEGEDDDDDDEGEDQEEGEEPEPESDGGKE